MEGVTLYLWAICALTILCLIPFGVALRQLGQRVIVETYHLNWMKHSRKKMKEIKKKNSFLWLLLCIEGFISNMALLLLIISIPLHFLFKI